ncbi:MAG: DUF222 domain-containing protein [Gammaproteobacteria bacterium]|nr:DUF222 domain-containing protein [Gammaproteobacteria bacterium]
MFDSEAAVIPDRLDELEPGPVLAAFLTTIDVGELSGYDRIVVLRAHQRMASHYQARIYEDMAAVADATGESDDALAVESAAAEIRVALRLTRRAADSELAFAFVLRRRLPRVWDELAAGDIDLRRAKTISYGTEHLPIALARDVTDRVLGDAPRLTSGQLAARIRRLCIDVDPDDARQRYQRAVGERRLIAEPTESGTAHLLGLDLAPDRVTAAAAKIDHLARSLKTADESRTMDQLRADVFLDLLDGTPTHATKTRGVVEIRVDLETLATLSDHPGELAGYGPVIADIARQVTEQNQTGQWRFTVTDPDTGQPAYHGTTRRRPTTGQRRHVETRNPTCVFPGCRMPAASCDLDHGTPYGDGGPTTVTNLAPLCRHDHRIRHDAGWTHQPLPGGDHRWTTKLGHTYTTSGTPP